MLLHRYRDPNGTFEVEFEDNVLTRLLGQCICFGKLETGGILVGYYDDMLQKAIIVQGSGAPRDSKHTRTRFYRGVDGLKDWLEEVWRIDKAYYLGEWHFHPFASSKMSSIDRVQMNKISADKTIHCPEPVLLIIGGDPSSIFSISLTVFNGEQPVDLTEHTVELI
ncbi:hypothetical protein PTQ21_27860 [Paenibacillus marchantiae]|uniref:hypothetical protein n=1 Tax=Paenibacillus marchantiae TaxID=3026433 RepID=UPI00237B75ED|nr:hypothetical protein [Paenibacillus marchantiae]WDQ32152.1 hypothetical protein PTQ21_27860 [Paenibacillus marchantiae]